LAFLSRRDRQPELMDQPGLDADTHRHALDGLRTTNSICRTAHVIWRGIMDLNIRPTGGQPLRVLDIAAGGGDVVLGLAKLGTRYGISMELHGCDINATAVEHAQNAANQAAVANVRFSQLNALTAPLPNDYDVLMCTLFLHHLSEVDARELLRRMAQAAKRCVIVDDLRRTRFGYFYAWAGGRLITRSHIVHTDGPLSVRAAFTIAEARQLALDAGLQNAHFRRHWPERYMMSWTKAQQ
jgi:2-polyprenyl-3-methyl-5-hydroxy-6-metoxy-1,4-benzoquinol methylase